MSALDKIQVSARQRLRSRSSRRVSVDIQVAASFTLAVAVVWTTSVSAQIDVTAALEDYATCLRDHIASTNEESIASTAPAAFRVCRNAKETYLGHFDHEDRESVSRRLAEQERSFLDAVDDSVDQ